MQCVTRLRFCDLINLFSVHFLRQTSYAHVIKMFAREVIDQVNVAEMKYNQNQNITAYEYMRNYFIN